MTSYTEYVIYAESEEDPKHDEKPEIFDYLMEIDVRMKLEVERLKIITLEIEERKIKSDESSAEHLLRIAGTKELETQNNKMIIKLRKYSSIIQSQIDEMDSIIYSENDNDSTHDTNIGILNFLDIINSRIKEENEQKKIKEVMNFILQDTLEEITLDQIQINQNLEAVKERNLEIQEERNIKVANEKFWSGIKEKSNTQQFINSLIENCLSQALREKENFHMPPQFAGSHQYRIRNFGRNNYGI
jgi:hypothetical protein